MTRKLGWAALLSTIVGLGILATAQAPQAKGQKLAAAVETQWEYKVTIFSYNPGERLTDDRRAARFEKTLNDLARQGWEPVGSLLSRDTIQTVGGGVTTLETVSFVTLKRPKR